MAWLQHENGFLCIAFRHIDFGNLVVGKRIHKGLKAGAHLMIFKEFICGLVYHVTLFMTNVNINVFSGQINFFGLATSQAQHQSNQAVAPSLGQCRKFLGRAIDRHEAERTKHHIRLRIGIKRFSRQCSTVCFAGIYTETQVNFKVSCAVTGTNINFRLDNATEEHFGSLRQKRVNADYGMRHGRISRSSLTMRQSPKFQIKYR